MSTPYSLLTPIHFLFLFPSLHPLHLLTQFLSFPYLLPISPPLSFDFFVSHQRKMLGVYFRVSKRNKLLDKYSLFPLKLYLSSLSFSLPCLIPSLSLSRENAWSWHSNELFTSPLPSLFILFIPLHIFQALVFSFSCRKPLFFHLAKIMRFHFA